MLQPPPSLEGVVIHQLESVRPHPADVAGAPCADAVTGDGVSPLAGSKRILFVDDEPAIRTLVRRVLEDLGYDVLEAADGTHALSLTKLDAGLDLLVTDVVMPHMGGPELADVLAERFPDLRVLFVSGSVDRRLDGAGSSVRLLDKPFTLSELGTAVRDVLDHARPFADRS
jgi:CheY-like chemotaxis protein